MNPDDPPEETGLCSSSFVIFEEILVEKGCSTAFIWEEAQEADPMEEPTATQEIGEPSPTPEIEEPSPTPEIEEPSPTPEIEEPSPSPEPFDGTYFEILGALFDFTRQAGRHAN